MRRARWRMQLWMRVMRCSGATFARPQAGRRAHSGGDRQPRVPATRPRVVCVHAHICTHICIHPRVRAARPRGPSHALADRTAAACCVRSMLACLSVHSFGRPYGADRAWAWRASCMVRRMPHDAQRRRAQSSPITLQVRLSAQRHRAAAACDRPAPRESAGYSRVLSGTPCCRPHAAFGVLCCRCGRRRRPTASAAATARTWSASRSCAEVRAHAACAALLGHRWHRCGQRRRLRLSSAHHGLRTADNAIDAAI